MDYKKVIQYVEPSANEPRARVMLVGDYDSWYHFSIINFDVIKPNFGYLYTEGKTTNRPKVKNLGMNIKVKGKNKANQVYLPAGQIIKIGVYGQPSGMNVTLIVFVVKL